MRLLGPESVSSPAVRMRLACSCRASCDTSSTHARASAPASETSVSPRTPVEARRRCPHRRTSRSTANRRSPAAVRRRTTRVRCRTFGGGNGELEHGDWPDTHGRHTDPAEVSISCNDEFFVGHEEHVIARFTCIHEPRLTRGGTRGNQRHTAPGTFVERSRPVRTITDRRWLVLIYVFVAVDILGYERIVAVEEQPAFSDRYRDWCLAALSWKSVQPGILAANQTSSSHTLSPATG